MVQCSAVNRSGVPCRALATQDGYCFAHSPTAQGRATAARSKGGRNSAVSVRVAKYLPESMRGLADQLVKGIEEVHEGQLEPSRLTAMATASGAVIRLYEIGETERRLRKVEARLEVTK